MTQRDDLLRRVMAANPLPEEFDLPDNVAGSRPPLDLLTNEGMVGLTDVLDKAPATASWTKERPWWAKPAAVFAAASLLVFGAIGIVAVSNGGQTDSVEEPAPTAITTLPPTESALYDVTYVSAAPDGSLWATTDGGLVRWDVTSGTPTMYSTDDGLPADDVSRVAVGLDGTVWAGGSGWIARFDGSWTVFSAPRDAGPMTVGPDGAAWTAFGERELARFDGLEWQTFEVSMSLDPGVAVPWTALLDVAADGTVWAGTNNLQGVFAFDGANWTHYTSVDGLPAPLSGTVAAAPDGTLWVGSVSVDDSPGAGAARFDGSTWTIYTTADGLLDDVPDVAVGADGTVWAIHQKGVSRFDGDTWTAFPDVSGIGMFASVDASGMLWMPSRDGGVIGFDGVDITRLEMPTKETPSPTTTTTGPAGTWNPILATTRAKTAPPAATCFPGTDPNAPGPADQERPEPGSTSLLAAVFDQHTGRIVYVDTLGETWTFDVCTNTWHRTNPTGVMIGELSAGMVYDVDSDLTVALGWEHISFYDANTNTWTQPSNEAIGFSGGPSYPMGAVYDPISGLIITTDLTDSYLDTWAYDVDSNTWTLIGRLWEQQGQDYTWFELLGYSRETDRLIFSSIDGITALVDPRTGDKTLITTPTPAISFGWPKAHYGPAADTVYVAEGVWRDGGMFNTRFPDQICGFDPGTSAWTSCFAIPNGSRYAAFGAMVGDPINNRLVLIHGVYGDFWVNADGNVWAIDLDTGELTELLGPSDE
jgi:hypothetical protein